MFTWNVILHNREYIMKIIIKYLGFEIIASYCEVIGIRKTIYFISFWICSSAIKHIPRIRVKCSLEELLNNIIRWIIRNSCEYGIPSIVFVQLLAIAIFRAR